MFSEQLDNALNLIFESKTYGCIVIHNDKLLMIKTSKGLELPKGHKEKKEQSHEAAKRETREETGAIVNIPNKDHKEIAIRKDGRKTIFYHANLEGQKNPTHQERGIEQFLWIPLEHININDVVLWQRDIVNKLIPIMA